MLTKFIEQKLKTARYKILTDSSYFGQIPSVRGVWANAKTLEGCRAELQEVLEDWVLLKVRDREKVAGLSIKFDRRRSVHA
jgi:predicted RNase H-like HicB family nuclease